MLAVSLGYGAASSPFWPTQTNGTFLGLETADDELMRMEEENTNGNSHAPRTLDSFLDLRLL